MFDFPAILNGHSVSILFGIFQGILISFFFAKKQRLKEHRFFVYFLSALLFVQVHAFLLRSGMMINVLYLLNTSTPVIFLFGPLIFIYTKSLSGDSMTLRQRLFHLLPFFFYLAYSFNFFLQDPAYKFNLLVEILQIDIPLKHFSNSFPTDPWNIQGWVVVEIMVLHLISYGLFSIIGILRKYSKESETNRSRMHWLNFLSAMLISGGFILFMSEGGIINGEKIFDSPFPPYSADLFSTFAMYGITLYLLTKPGFIAAPIQKYSKSSLSKEIMKAKLIIIKQIIEENKLFLDPNFSLELVAQKTGLGKHHISQIINSELDCNFFFLTNRYRIEEAKRIIKESRYIKMEQLAYQLGYKSKSTFFNAFKKVTNLTPGKYMEEAV